MSRTDTNRLLKDLAQSIEENPEDGIFITVVAGGQLISGELVSEDQFFSLADNIALKDLYEQFLKNPRQEALAALEKGEEVDFSNDLKEYFIYLNHVSYLNTEIPFQKNESISAQVRVSDISAFTFRGIKQ
ncbi:hypothetical protein KW868_02730 [Acinetobacter guillouiae]|uniref:Uncharacterized protein n=1 Tax=Acinetobacter guillouiae TaxID=106649 RepID=A0A8X8GMZ3_ACIGI|nr:hypothetical protein [Acinetobacter guillouiae]MCF0263391.1 hypothetical protein [Acinetobacter guillouiae]